MAALGLKASDVGRFRDCYLTDKGEIAVYTRNGGGNRERCWHADDPKWADEGCGGEAYQAETDEIVHMTVAEGEASGYKQAWTQLGSETQPFRTGKHVMETRHTCGHPESEKCVCPACTINYRMPKHPHYLRDEDDDFDSTYATIYFKVPDNIDRDALQAVSPEMAREEVWQKFLSALQQTGVVR